MSGLQESLFKSESDRGGMGGLEVHVDGTDLERAAELLGKIDEKAFDQAINSAMRRAMESARTKFKKSLTTDYTLSQRDFLHNVSIVTKTRDKISGNYAATAQYRGHVIPLISFSNKVTSDGRITAQVKRSSTPKALARAFKADINNHLGIYAREGEERLPIKELYGPSVPQMMYSNEEILETATQTAVDTFDKRMEHELDAFLNGWRSVYRPTK